MGKIFISHCQADEPIVHDLVELIRIACDLNNDNFFCTCVKGMGVSAGDIFSEKIRKNFMESNVVVAFLTKNYKASEFCMAELGASWVTKDDKVFIPLIDSDIDYNFFKGVLTGVHELKINDEYGLLQLCDIICDKLEKKKKLEVVTDSVRRFLKTFSGLKAQCSSPFTCTQDEWNRVNSQMSFFKKMSDEAQEVIEEKNNLISRLEKLKDKAEVEELYAQVNEDEIEELRIAAKNIYNKRFDFPNSIVFKFIVYSRLGLGEPLFESHEYMKLDEAVKPKILEKDSDECYSVNTFNRHVSKLYECIDAFVDKVTNASKEVSEYYAEKLDVDFDIENSEFIDKMIDL